MGRMNSKNVTIGETTFVIFPFGAFYAANLSGELARFLGPVLAGVLPLLFTDDSKLENKSISDYMPMIISGLQTLDGNTLELLLKKLLIAQQNITAQYRDEDGRMHTEPLTLDLADELFCQRIEDLLQLAIEVIQYNWSGFFTKLNTQYGSLLGSTPGTNSGSMEISMSASSENLK